MRSKGTDDN